MNYIIGVDCGGTKTQAQAYSLEGMLLNEVQTGFGNLIVDYTQGLKNIQKAIDDLMKLLEDDICVHITLGIAGIDSGGLKEKVFEDLNQYYPSITLINDGQLAHYTLLKGQDGITVTAGTGSVILGLKDENWFRVGGWGHLFGDDGAAYGIAKDAIQHVLYDYDSGKPYSPLSVALLRHFDVQSALELIKKVYQMDKATIAQSSLVVATESSTDTDARVILENAGKKLADQVIMSIKKMNVESSIIDIGLNGSVIEKNKTVQSAFESTLLSNHIQYKLHLKKESCAKGAYYLMKRNGLK